MNMITAVAKKELRTYFLSPVALIFIATFLLASLFAFFWVEGFFSRNVADIRPLFQWLPILLIFLVPALGMRLWSEEERMGTMELLRTFPLPTAALVVGKFLSGVGLIAVALALTLPVPLTVNMLGNLDWGPVWGGYLATLLLASAYLSITLCVSAATASQLIALVFASVACGALYLLGAESVASLFGNMGGEFLRAVGAGSRFESILRGVVDLRDLLYYASLIGFFLLLNIGILDARRWSESEKRSRFRFNARARLGLLAANLIILNVLATSVHGLRLDLTENHEYSISPVTENMLAELDEPLLIRGYFSSKTHPLLAPLVPRIRDLIQEYGAIGGDHVRAEFVDPTTNPKAEKEANQDYGIRSVPFQFADRHQASIVNSYFNILLRYGDQYETLSFDDLIEVQAHGMDIDVRLRNLEYDLTRSIQKVVYGFQSLESVLARLPEKAMFTAFVTKNGLPEGFEEVAERIEKVATEITERSAGRFEWKTVDPDAEDAEIGREELYRRYGFQPMALSMFSDETFYMYLLLEVGEYRERLMPPGSQSEADIRSELVAALKRAGPGSLKSIGLATSSNSMGLRFSKLRNELRETYQVEDVDLEEGRVSGEIDVLLVLDPRDFKEKQIYAIDQFLMRGGSVIIATSGHALNAGRGDLSVSKVTSGLDDLLKNYGIRVGKEVVLDTQNAAFPIPVSRNLGGFMVQEIQMMNYPAFVDIRGEGMDDDNPALAGLGNVVMHWPSTVELIADGEDDDDDENGEDDDDNDDDKKAFQDTEESDEEQPTAEEPVLREAKELEEREAPTSRVSSRQPMSRSAQASVLLQSSSNAWLLDDFKAQPDFELYTEVGWPTRGDPKTFSLAVARIGNLTSYYKDREPPVLDGDAASEEDDDSFLNDTDDTDEEADNEDAKEKSGRRGNVMELSPERSRLVVLGSASFVSDFIGDLSRQGMDANLGNMQLLQNLVDWCIEDIDLLEIRSRGAHARLLEPTSLGTRKVLEWGNYIFAIVAVVVIGAVFLRRRRKAKPFDLVKPSQDQDDVKDGFRAEQGRAKGAA